MSRHPVLAVVDAVEEVLSECALHSGGHSTVHRTMAERLTIVLFSRGSVGAEDVEAVWSHEHDGPLSLRRSALEVAALTRAVNTVPDTVMVSGRFTVNWLSQERSEMEGADLGQAPVPVSRARSIGGSDEEHGVGW